MSPAGLEQAVMWKSGIYSVFICLVVLSSCEKVWMEDLQEKALDTIRGIYEIESAVWEGSEPIDIDGDGNAAYDYKEECDRITVGWCPEHIVSNKSGRLYIPYIVDEGDDWEGYPLLGMHTREYRFKLEAVVENGESRLEFVLPEQNSVFVHSGYGEITLRTEVTFTALISPDQTKEFTGPVLFKFIRTEYTSGE